MEVAEKSKHSPAAYLQMSPSHDFMQVAEGHPGPRRIRALQPASWYCTGSNCNPPTVLQQEAGNQLVAAVGGYAGE